MLGKVFKKRPNLTAVIFRKSMDGEIIAIFPEKQWEEEEEGKIAAYTCSGQYVGVGPFTILASKPAGRKEYSALQMELESAGYLLNIDSRTY